MTSNVCIFHHKRHSSWVTMWVDTLWLLFKLHVSSSWQSFTYLNCFHWSRNARKCDKVDRLILTPTLTLTLTDFNLFPSECHWEKNLVQALTTWRPVWTPSKVINSLKQTTNPPLEISSTQMFIASKGLSECWWCTVANTWGLPWK